MNGLANILAQRDGGAGEVIVWIILGIVWAIAQVVSRARQKKNLPGQPPAERRTKPHVDLEEFFEQLQKQHEESAAPRPVRPQPEPPRAATPPPPPPPIPVATPAPRPVVRQMPPRPRPKPQPVRVPMPAAAPQPVVRSRPRPERIDFPPLPDIRPTIAIADSYPTEGTTKAIRSGMFSVRSGCEGMDSSMKGLRLMPDAHRKASSDIRGMFQGRQVLKRSLISRFVLGPPRSQQPWDYPEA